LMILKQSEVRGVGEVSDGSMKIRKEKHIR
jgi:hypothetical protein